jgi:hypothetical protein
MSARPPFVQRMPDLDSAPGPVGATPSSFTSASAQEFASPELAALSPSGAAQPSSSMTA